MSGLQRAFAKAKLSGLPPNIPQPLNDLPETNEEEEETDGFGSLPSEKSDDDSSISSASSTGTIRPTSRGSNGKFFARPNAFVHSFHAANDLLICKQSIGQILGPRPCILDLLFRA